MAIEDLGVLRDSLPDVFRDAQLPPDWDDPFIFVPVDNPVGYVPNDVIEWIDDLPLVDDPLVPLELPPDLNGDFPGALARVPVHGSRPEQVPERGRTGLPLPPATPPDCLAFYLPFHYFYPHWWGVYLTVEGTLAVAKFIHTYDPLSLTLRDAYLAAQAFLYGHEYYHHKVECFATKLEVTHRDPLYKTTFEKIYQRHVGTGRSWEELLATAYGYEKALEPFRSDKAKKQAVANALELYISALPAGYREARSILSSGLLKAREVAFAEENQYEAFPQNGGKPAELWLVFPNAFQGISRRTSRVNYIVRRNSPIAHRSGLALRYLRYKELIEKLDDMAGIEYRREGKGSHVIFRSKGTGNNLEIPRHPGDLSPGVVRNIIKKAGISLSLEEFARHKRKANV